MARLVNGFATLALGAASLLVGAGVRAQEALPAGWLDSQVDEGGRRCHLHEPRKLAERLLLACGAAGVWEVALEAAGPRFVRSYAFDGDAVGFLSEPDGRVWVKVETLTARPLTAGAQAGRALFPEDGARAPLLPAPLPSAIAPGKASSSPPPDSPPPPKPRTAGKVESVKPGEVLISLGEKDNVSRHARVELYWPAAGDDGSSEQSLAVGVVTSASDRTAKVRLGLNEVVDEGASARLTELRPSASLSAPPRAAALWSLDLMARPFAPMGELGGGVLLSAALGRRFESSWHVRALIDPAAIVDVEDHESVTAASVSVLGSYDSQYFEMGLGLGAQTVNDTNFVLPPGSGLAVSQYLRLGAADGLNVVARTSLVLFHSRFEFGGMVAAGQIPMSRGSWLLLGGGGGIVGYGYGEFGVRVLVGGNGSRGSKYLTVTAGGAAVFESPECGQFDSCQPTSLYGGPMAGIGGEWRF